MATLYDLAMQYLAQALPDGKIFPDTIPPLVPPTEDEDTPAQPGTPAQGIINTGAADGFSVYNPDPTRLRTADDYSPFNARRYYARPDSDVGIPSGILSDSKFLYGDQVQLPGVLGIGQEFLKTAMPTNRRAILENEALGSGIRLDDIGRVVAGPGSINTAENIMAGYNLAKVTPETIQKRRDMINKNMKDPEQKAAKLKALNEFEEKMFGTGGIMDLTEGIYGQKETKRNTAKDLKKGIDSKKSAQILKDTTFGFGLPPNTSTYDEDDEDEVLEEILRSQIIGSPISYGGFPGYGVAPASGLSVAPGAIIDQGLSVAPGGGGGGITNIDFTSGDITTSGGITTGNIYDEFKKPAGTINITNPYSGGSGGVQSNFGSSSGGGGPSYSGMGSIGSGGSKSSSKNSSQAGGGSNKFGFSDIRLKENVKLIGKSPSNINIYKFNYKDNPTTYQGVMAHEVPWANVKHSNGYMMVDYNKVDVEFKKWQR